MQLGYFQVMAEPVSTCVQEILVLTPAAGAALGDEVVDAAFAFLVAGIPVLHGAEYLMLALSSATSSTTAACKLVFIAHRGGAAFEIADAGAFVGDDQRALELARCSWR